MRFAPRCKNQSLNQTEITTLCNLLLAVTMRTQLWWFFGLGFFGGSWRELRAGGYFACSYCFSQVHSFSCASKSHFHDGLFWSWGVKPNDCICISCTSRKHLIAKTKTSVCISWTHTSITSITSHPDSSKVIQMPAKHLEISPCYSLQRRQLKILQQQALVFAVKLKEKYSISSCLFLNNSVKREMSQDPGARCMWSVDIKLSWPYLCWAGGGCNLMQLSMSSCLLQIILIVSLQMKHRILFH